MDDDFFPIIAQNTDNLQSPPCAIQADVEPFEGVIGKHITFNGASERMLDVRRGAAMLECRPENLHTGNLPRGSDNPVGSGGNEQ
ncbi:MAG: hypothetical protein GXX86_05285 [Propionibacterium sp.]|nr:hypothetical protein [Propionibacterium sp.]